MGTIAITGLVRAFKGTVAVDSVDLDIEDGEFCVLLGPSGCGKTTLLRMIAGLLEPTAGTIALDGRDITHLPSRSRDIAMVFQSYALYPHLSVRKNLEFPLTQVRRGGAPKLSEEQRHRRVEEVAASLDISHLLDRRPKALSGGQRQRVAVGRALVREPKAFLMDEPLSNLDASLRTQTRQELTALHQRLGATFVYVTHDQVEAMTMATKIVVLNSGRIEQVGTPLDVYDRPASTFVATFIGSPAMNLLPATVSGVAGQVRITGTGLQAELWPGDTPEREVLLGVRPEHLHVLAPGRSADVAFSAEVTNVEQLGHETVLYARAGDSDVRVRRPRSADVATGDTIRVGLGLEHLHLFAADSGRRLEWTPEDEPAEPAPAALPV